MPTLKIEKFWLRMCERILKVVFIYLKCTNIYDIA